MGPGTGLSPPPLPCRSLAPHRAPAAIPPEAASGNPAPSGRHLRTWPRPQAACPQLAPGCPALGSCRPLWPRPLRPRSSQPSCLTSSRSRRLASTSAPRTDDPALVLPCLRLSGTYEDPSPRARPSLRSVAGSSGLFRHSSPLPSTAPPPCLLGAALDSRPLPQASPWSLLSSQCP